jgi:uncharacterized membrane protein YhaH (DUF805 family)
LANGKRDFFMGFMGAVRSGFSNYVTFSGRARRSEYWYWVLFVVIVAFFALFLDMRFFPEWVTASAEVAEGMASAQATGGPITALVGLGLFLPGLAVTVRRLHDTDRRGWWILLGLIPIIGIIVLIVFYCTAGTPGPNRFGPDPKA